MRQRLGIESDHEAQISGQGINFFHPENWHSIQAAIRTVLKLTGLFWRGQRNTERIEIRHNYIVRQDLPTKFDGFTIRHLSDLHADRNQARSSVYIADPTNHDLLLRKPAVTGVET